MGFLRELMCRFVGGRSRPCAGRAEGRRRSDNTVILPPYNADAVRQGPKGTLAALEACPGLNGPSWKPDGGGGCPPSRQTEGGRPRAPPGLPIQPRPHLLALLNNCGGDVREYLREVPFDEAEYLAADVGWLSVSGPPGARPTPPRQPPDRLHRTPPSHACPLDDGQRCVEEWPALRDGGDVARETGAGTTAEHCRRCTAASSSCGMAEAPPPAICPPFPAYGRCFGQ